GLRRVDEIARNGGGRGEIRRIAEHVQLDPKLMTELKEVGVLPGKEVDITSVVGANKPVEIRGENGSTELPPSIAHAIMVCTK
ncbi:ferrous iron transport protein A, partial [Klebsiella pneumoniae]|nr:ferrous iron transport protein A [Klebsiella pneumoniae]